METVSVRGVNNAIYDTLGDRWYEADDDPVALLRAESRLRRRWVLDELRKHLGPGPHAVLDVGCGAGFVANDLARAGHSVTGLDAAPSSLDVARAHDTTATVRYELGDAHRLPYEDSEFDAVCAMDFLEHTERPARVVAEAARVLRRGGAFLFHTFNRNILSWLVVIKGVEWFVDNTPPDLHVIQLFLKPEEVVSMCRDNGLALRELVGSRPRLDRAFWQLLRTGKVSPSFAFVHTRSTLMGYSGVVQKAPGSMP